jgi:uncharacterized membrane protein
MHAKKTVDVLQKLLMLLEIYKKMYAEGEINDEEYDKLIRPLEDILHENGVGMEGMDF